jgi:hypothetical protein
MMVYVCLKILHSADHIWQSLLNTAFVQTPANNGKQIAVFLDTAQYSVLLFRVIVVVVVVVVVYFGNTVYLHGAESILEASQEITRILWN